MAERGHRVVHLVKVCVGVERVEQLVEWQAMRLADTGRLVHVTRNRPKRADEVLAGGSLYWIIAGAVRVRQRIVGLDEVQTETGMQCGLVFAPDLVRTEPWPRGPHQGWRYLEAKDAPPDLPEAGLDAALPEDLRAQLRDLGLR